MLPPATLPRTGQELDTTSIASASKASELASKSTPLLLKDTATAPTFSSGVTHRTSVELTNRAGTPTNPKRQIRLDENTKFAP